MAAVTLFCLWTTLLGNGTPSDLLYYPRTTEDNPELHQNSQIHIDTRVTVTTGQQAAMWLLGLA